MATKHSSAQSIDIDHDFAGQLYHSPALWVRRLADHEAVSMQLCSTYTRHFGGILTQKTQKNCFAEVHDALTCWPASFELEQSCNFRRIVDGKNDATVKHGNDSRIGRMRWLTTQKKGVRANENCSMDALTTTICTVQFRTMRKEFLGYIIALRSGRWTGCVEDREHRRDEIR